MTVKERTIYSFLHVTVEEQELCKLLIKIAESMHDELDGMTTDEYLYGIMEELANRGCSDLDEWR